MGVRCPPAILGTSASAPWPCTGRPVMSSPAEKARPDPVITTTRTASSIWDWSRVSTRSRFMPWVMPFSRSGWLNVMTAIPGSCSVKSKPRKLPVSISVLRLGDCPSLAGERGGALLHERPRRLAVIAGRTGQNHVQRLLVQERQQITRLGAVQVLLHAGVGEGGAAGQVRGEGHRLLLQLVVRDDPAHHTDLQRFLGLDDLAGEVQLARLL